MLPHHHSQRCAPIYQEPEIKINTTSARPGHVKRNRKQERATHVEHRTRCTHVMCHKQLLETHPEMRARDASERDSRQGHYTEKHPSTHLPPLPRDVVVCSAFPIPPGEYRLQEGEQHTCMYCSPFPRPSSLWTFAAVQLGRAAQACSLAAAYGEQEDVHAHLISRRDVVRVVSQSEGGPSCSGIIPL